MFPLTGLPDAFNFIVRLNPLSYGVDGLRGALTGSYFYGPALDLTVLISVAVILTVLGSYLFTKIEV